MTNGYSSYRDYFTDDASRQSDWQTLTQGEYYYIEVAHAQSGGGDHLTVSLEIEQSAVANHPNKIKPIQAVKIIPNSVSQEVWSVTINNPVIGGTFVVTIGPTTTNITGAISQFASAN
jgi:hypothetical protein